MLALIGFAFAVFMLGYLAGLIFSGKKKSNKSAPPEKYEIKYLKGDFAIAPKICEMVSQAEASLVSCEKN